MDNIKEKDLVLAEVMLKLSALQRVLVKKGLFTEQEFKDEINNIGQEISEMLK